MQAFYDLPAPAKLNLFLHITGRRADGYHLLQSVFMLIDWADSIDVMLRSDGIISREDSQPSGGHGASTAEVLPSDDLCVRAARALQAASGCAQGAHIRLRKQIPTQAGMGGGSSDAATCLLALNRLWGLHLPLSKLQQIGLQLGADVPFFLRGSNAWVEGVGESITPIDLPAAQFVVLKPQLGLPTHAIFGHPALKRDSQHAIISGFAADHYGFGHNDLQPVAELINPEVSQALSVLRAQGLQPRMTGSGSAVFAKLSGDESLNTALNNGFEDGFEGLDGWQQKVCSNLSAHPLKGWAI
jgi:4-diphosphocytidyl-2-C-methyl-D-erythritol kinase